MTAIANSYNHSEKTSQTFSFNSINRNEPKTSQPKDLLNWLEGHEAVEIEGIGGFDFKNFPESQKKFQTIYFHLKGEVESFYSLFRGLVLAGHPKEVFIESIHEKRYFTLKYYQSNEGIAKAYVNKLFKLIEDEIRFKKVLKKIIQNQKKHQLEESLLYSELS
ncbi:hypothetical protein QWY93_12900 [Echinicola jeungdonensis]|uniref:Uncharacterized protein n=1 Tax=Echinicola jeungdonensis TaxID=709343 RepID=A0ABV5J9U8_9BACT|nr:hypothetical protein [Echinicola jeungdonensis]MDN3670223.1 hypothetical protein [Echinicola jeungdonensis]